MGVRYRICGIRPNAVNQEVFDHAYSYYHAQIRMLDAMSAGWDNVQIIMETRDQ